MGCQCAIDSAQCMRTLECSTDLYIHLLKECVVHTVFEMAPGNSTAVAVHHLPSSERAGKARESIVAQVASAVAEEGAGLDNTLQGDGLWVLEPPEGDSGNLYVVVRGLHFGVDTARMHALGAGLRCPELRGAQRAWLHSLLCPGDGDGDELWKHARVNQDTSDVCGAEGASVPSRHVETPRHASRSAGDLVATHSAVERSKTPSFTSIKVINLARRADRWQQLTTHMRNFG